MLKYSYLFFIIFSVTLLFTGCGAAEPESAGTSAQNIFTITPEADANKTGDSSTDPPDTNSSDGLNGNAGKESPDPAAEGLSVFDIDIDLTAMSDTMMIAMIQSIYSNTDDYLGKTIKMAGDYYINYDPDLKQFLHFILYFDESACCSYGFEIEFTDTDVSANDMPANGTGVEVTGKFSKQTDGGEIYYYLESYEFAIK